MSILGVRVTNPIGMYFYIRRYMCDRSAIVNGADSYIRPAGNACPICWRHAALNFQYCFPANTYDQRPKIVTDVWLGLEFYLRR